jgi:glutamine amidotransferase
MCRWLAYWGEPIFLDEFLFAPCHSLIDQSLHAREAKGPTNGDGFGIGWYALRPNPGVYHDILPAWSDPNLRHLAHQLQSGRFFAHVRASTGTATSRANCHPFVHGRSLFMHNGQIGGYFQLKRRLEQLLPDELYAERAGTTDSELIHLLMIAAGIEAAPAEALGATIRQIEAAMATRRIAEPLRLTAAWSDGAQLVACRYASDGHPPTLYWRQAAGRIVLVSEPLDDDRGGWQPVPAGQLCRIDADGIQFAPVP